MRVVRAGVCRTVWFDSGDVSARYSQPYGRHGRGGSAAHGHHDAGTEDAESDKCVFARSLCQGLWRFRRCGVCVYVSLCLRDVSVSILSFCHSVILSIRPGCLLHSVILHV